MMSSHLSPVPSPTVEIESGAREIRGRTMEAEEYLGHVAYAYAAAPADSAEESIAKGLLEMACERLGIDPQETIGAVLQHEPGGRILAPWHPEHPGQLPKKTG